MRWQTQVVSDQVVLPDLRGALSPASARRTGLLTVDSRAGSTCVATLAKQTADATRVRSRLMEASVVFCTRKLCTTTRAIIQEHRGQLPASAGRRCSIFDRQSSR